MSMLAFFPWLRLKESIVVGEFELVPYLRGHQPAGRGTQLQDTLGPSTRTVLLRRPTNWFSNTCSCRQNRVHSRLHRGRSCGFVRSLRASRDQRPCSPRVLCLRRLSKPRQLSSSNPGIRCVRRWCCHYVPSPRWIDYELLARRLLQGSETRAHST